MYWLGLGTQITGIALLACILMFLRRGNLVRAFPFFSTYAICVLLTTICDAATLSLADVYFYVFWITTPINVILAILAVHESFGRVFRVFYLLPWFRFLFPASIVVALVYSVIRGYLHPPIAATPLSAAIISLMIAAQYVILAICIAFFGLAKLLRVAWRVHEYRFMLGFGVSSVCMAFAASVRSEFGTRFDFLSGMLPAVSYIVALAIWLSAVVHSNAEVSGATGELSREELVMQLRRQLATVRALLRS